MIHRKHKNKYLLLKSCCALRKKSQRLFLFLEKTFIFINRDCLLSLLLARQLSNLGKRKFFLGKETSNSRLSLSEKPLSSSTELLFYFLSLHFKNELDQPISFGVFPWSWKFYVPKGYKKTFHLFIKKQLLILSKMCNFLVKKGVHWKKMCVLQLRNRSLFRGRNACSASTRHLNGSCVIKVF